MKTPTLAQKLGTTTHWSCLRHEARKYGLHTEKDLIREAVARGCFHFLQADQPPSSQVSEAEWPNEKLALAMLTISNPYDPWLIRAGAMLLSHPANNASQIALHTRHERSETVIRDIALAGRRYEPENVFWEELLRLLPEAPAPQDGVLPHHSRYVSIPGKIGPGKMGKPVWLRPRKLAALGYAA